MVGTSALRRAVAVALLVAIAVALAWHIAGRGDEGLTRPSPVEKNPAVHPRGGSVKIGVTSPPELSDRGTGGSTLRQLVLPSLFVIQPDGTWRTSLAEPGSDRTRRDARSATFELRRGAQWSDGTPITIDDLKRTKDDRFVDRVEGPDARGVITAYFKMRYPQWRRLWSGSSAIAPPRQDVYGGPFVVQEITSGLETVLVRNPHWFGVGGSPYLDEVRLVIASESVIAKQLLSTGQIDVLAPLGDTVRTDQLKQMPGISVSMSEESGRRVGLSFDPAKLDEGQRRRVIAEFPRLTFVDALLHGEATVLDGFAGEKDSTWASLPGAGGVALGGTQVSSSALVEDPLTPLLQQTLRGAVERSGGVSNVTSLDAGSSETAMGDHTYDVVMEMNQDEPDPCWTCQWDGVDASLARKADEGDHGAARELEAKLRDEALYLPLWREQAVVGWRTSVVEGLEANGYATGPAWNVDRWWHR